MIIKDKVLFDLAIGFRPLPNPPLKGREQHLCLCSK